MYYIILGFLSYNWNEPYGGTGPSYGDSVILTPILAQHVQSFKLDRRLNNDLPYGNEIIKWPNNSRNI